MSQFRTNMPNDFSSIQAAGKMFKVTKGSALTPGPCRCLLVGNAGTLNLTDLDGTEHDDVPVIEGYNQLAVSEVRSGGTATDIWALYT